MAEDAFFKPIALDPKRADGLFPYRLVVVDVSKESLEIVVSQWSSYGNGGFKENQVTKNSTNTGGISYALTNYEGGQWEFTLPITPQQLSIVDQFAINTTATMRGIVEEHNGVKFKMITASGTTGIWPTRPSHDFPDSSGYLEGALEDLFSDSINAIKKIGKSFNTLKPSSNGKSAPKLVDPFSEENKKQEDQSTGYCQALLLQQFLEQYAMAKKNPENKGWRLVFDCPKNNESFIVTPITFSTTKNQRSPGESLFNMQFKAWKRIDLKAASEGVSGKIRPLDSNLLRDINNSLDNARALMSASSGLIKAVRADFRKPFDTMRRMSLLVKDFSGVALSVAELPSQIGKDISSSTKKRSKDLAQAGESLSKAGTLIANGFKEEDERNEGLSSTEVSAGVLGQKAADTSNISKSNKPFEEQESNYELFSVIDLDSLELTPQQRDVIDDEIEANSLISNQEIKAATLEIKDLILDLTNNLGAGDQWYSDTFGRPDPKFRATPMSIEEFELIVAMEEAVLQLNLLTSTRDFDDVKILSALEYVGGLADESGIPFHAGTSAKKLVPVPYNLTIQEISARYLGSPDRYNEIITLNAMRSPYIDEDGFYYSFLTNGDGRQFNIDTSSKLFVGQKIQLSSNTQPTFTRKITAIEQITDTNYLISVDGVNDLHLLTVTDQAQIKAFLPGTVNSQNQIYIPSNESIEAESRTYDIPYLKEDTLTSMSKVDWLLEDSGDIVINSFGEVALANGTNNLVQALKMKIKTAKGSILANPEFGLGIVPGVNVTDITVSEVLKDLKATILADSRFSAIEKLEMNILPPDLSLTIVVRLANGNGIFPINFTV